MGDIADSIIDNIVDDCCFESHSKYFRSKRKSAEPKEYINFKSIIKESDKAWLLLLENDKEQWYPKKYCIIFEKHKNILVPEWLLKKIEEDKKK